MRMRLILVALFAAVMAVTVRGVSAQTTTADGVAALARGDYQRAVEILKPIAEALGSNDNAAQFFMAGLYESGHGVAADPLRACALYQRATSQTDSPFGRLAMTLFAAVAGRSEQFNQECQMLANTGFDNGFEPATFDLGPGHSVEWTLSGVTVTYQGQTERVDMPLAMPGARFLPLRHTELATGPARAVTRHFVEVFYWHPADRSGGWNLSWHLFEIVGRQIIRIDTPVSVFSAASAEPPPLQTFDASEHALVRVDSTGSAEWAILKGPYAGTEQIESEAERREIRDVERARSAAMARVKWDSRYDVHRPPSLASVDADGCGLLHVHGWTADRSEVVVVGVRLPEKEVPAPTATFDLARESATASVEAQVYDAPQRRFDFCSDVRVSEVGSIEPEVWRAVAGTMTVELSPPGVRARHPSMRRANITLTNLVLSNAAGMTIRVTRPVTLSAIVGLMW